MVVSLASEAEMMQLAIVGWLMWSLFDEEENFSSTVYAGPGTNRGTLHFIDKTRAELLVPIEQQVTEYTASICSFYEIFMTSAVLEWIFARKNDGKTVFIYQKAVARPTSLSIWQVTGFWRIHIWPLYRFPKSPSLNKKTYAPDPEEIRFRYAIDADGGKPRVDVLFVILCGS
jgi:hypothetical protein